MYSSNNHLSFRPGPPKGPWDDYMLWIFAATVIASLGVGIWLIIQIDQTTSGIRKPRNWIFFGLTKKKGTISTKLGVQTSERSQVRSMTDFFVRPTPLPISRPSGLDDEYQAFTAAGMPLERPTEAADALFQVGSYPPSGEHVKPLYGLLIESSGILVILAIIGLVYRRQIWDYLISLRTRLRGLSLFRQLS